ncbi:MAG: hypothetical protein R3E08_13135 [Thiotrichaceae bacterium]
MESMVSTATGGDGFEGQFSIAGTTTTLPQMAKCYSTTIESCRCHRSPNIWEAANATAIRSRN